MARRGWVTVVVGSQLGYPATLRNRRNLVARSRSRSSDDGSKFLETALRFHPVEQFSLVEVDG
jgi:hypothetical protein